MSGSRREIFEKFSQEEIGPITQQAGFPGVPEVQFFEVHNYHTAGSSATSSLVAAVAACHRRYALDGTIAKEAEGLCSVSKRVAGVKPEVARSLLSRLLLTNRRARQTRSSKREGYSMAIVVHVVLSGVTREQHDRVRSIAALDWTRCPSVTITAT